MLDIKKEKNLKRKVKNKYTRNKTISFIKKDDENDI